MVTVGTMQPYALMAAEPGLKVAPASSKMVSSYIVPDSNEPKLTHGQKLELLKSRIKYVFVLFQENRSFDLYFGSYPGANGLFPANNQPGRTQQIVDNSGNVTTISPFKIPTTVTVTGTSTQVPRLPRRPGQPGPLAWRYC